MSQSFKPRARVFRFEGSQHLARGAAHPGAAGTAPWCWGPLGCAALGAPCCLDPPCPPISGCCCLSCTVPTRAKDGAPAGEVQPGPETCQSHRHPGNKAPLCRCPRMDGRWFWCCLPLPQDTPPRGSAPPAVCQHRSRSCHTHQALPALVPLALPGWGEHTGAFSIWQRVHEASALCPGEGNLQRSRNGGG